MAICHFQWLLFHMYSVHEQTGLQGASQQDDCQSAGKLLMCDLNNSSLHLGPSVLHAACVSRRHIAVMLIWLLYSSYCSNTFSTQHLCNLSRHDIIFCLSKPSLLSAVHLTSAITAVKDNSNSSARHSTSRVCRHVWGEPKENGMHNSFWDISRGSFTKYVHKTWWKNTKVWCVQTYVFMCVSLNV